jgi:ABC-type uncharacterized transport system involved in gliding motility auxiliary subunit
MKKKLKTFNWNTLKYLFWLSPVFIVMGLTAGSIAGWTSVPVGLVIVGVLLGVAWLVWQGATQKSFWQRRSTQEGTNAIIATVAVLVILGLINFLAARYAPRVDLTENQIFTLAPQSQLVAQQLEQPVRAVVFAQSPDSIDQQLLENYRRESEQFSYEYIDPQAQPGVAQQFGVQTFGEVYLESGNTRRLIQTINTQERLSERRLTNGLAQINSIREQRVYFLQGHGERELTEGQGGFAQVQASLSEEGYSVEPLNLAENPTVPEDAGVLVVAGPQRPLLEAEVNALRSHLERRGGLLLLIDPQTEPNNPQIDFGLNPLLQEWGVRLNDRIIIDPAGQASGLGLGVTIVNDYGNHPITRGFGNGISFYPLARPLETAEIPNVEAVQLLVTSDRTEAHRLGESGELEFNPETDPRGPFNLGLALSRALPEAAEPAAEETSPDAAAEEGVASLEETEAPEAPEEDTDLESAPQSRLVVIGNASFAGNGLLEQQLNGDVFLNSISWLSQQDDEVLSIRPREMTNRRILMTPIQQLSSALFAIAFLPLLGILAAAFVWWRRR